MELSNGVISLIPVTSEDFPGFAEIKLLYYRAFQPNERREVSDLVAQMNKPGFTLLMIQMYNMPAGLIALWQLSSFIFIEHIAVTEQLRNKKIGETAINMIADSQDQPILLETAHGTDSFSKSRIEFYKRSGFEIIDDLYEQPAYSKEKTAIKMLLMCNCHIDPDKTKELAAEIHNIVYNQ
ncbi:MAG: GNAT family N-acetyltransferase [Lentimicrobium sp.]|nr:GNAT family N-acetyltransferase [Lentimicrobium sp.]